MARLPSFDTASAGRSLRRVLLFATVVVGLLYAGCATTTRVDAGHVGIRVKLAGSERGVQDMPVVTGWVFFNPLTEQIVLFPTSVQNVVWTQSAHEGRQFDESVTFSSGEGVNVNADIGLSFHIDPALAPKLYGRFRLNDLEKLAPAAFLYQFDRACLIEIGLRGLTPTSLLKPQLAIAAQAIGLAGR